MRPFFLFNLLKAALPPSSNSSRLNNVPLKKSLQEIDEPPPTIYRIAYTLQKQSGPFSSMVMVVPEKDIPPATKPKTAIPVLEGEEEEEKDRLPAPIKLRPPPCRSEGPQGTVRRVYLPLPPGPLQQPPPPPRRSGAGRRRVAEDPFFAAYKECTKSVKVSKSGKGGGVGGGRLIGLWKGGLMMGISCKQSSVVEGVMVRMSVVINSPARREHGNRS